jgi:hypothetical protein
MASDVLQVFHQQPPAAANHSLCLLHALAVASALVITPAVRAVRLAPRAACPTMDGDGPMVGKCKWFK